ncbi:MAG: ATP-binding protein [Methanobacteriota archaeon]
MSLELTPTELQDLLQREEGQFLEFKSLWDQSGEQPRVLDRRKVRDAIAEYVAAFANADGGLLVLGVEDDGTPTGHGYPEDAVADFLAVPERRLRSPPRARAQRERLDGHEVILIQVDAAAEAVMVEGNGFPYRVGDTVVREPQEVINERKAAYRRVGFEPRIHPDATLDDLDLDLVRETLRRTIHKDRKPEDALVHYGLIAPKPGGFGITNAALLLFSKAPVACWHPRASVRVFRVAGKERQHGAKRNVTQVARIETPIAKLIPETHQLLATQIRRSERLHNLFFTERPEYPEFAWQEAIVNAVAHRDYGDQGREIEVWLFEDRMEVSSPGELVSPVTIQDLRNRRRTHASRNPLIVRLLADMGIMRDEGEGVARMHEEMEASYLKAPELHADRAEFRVTLHNEPVFEGPSPEWQRTVRSLPLNDRQRRVLLAQPQGFTNEDYRRLNRGVDRDEAYREIQEMVQLGIVTPPAAPGRGATYRLTPDLHQTKGWLESRVPPLNTYFKANEALKNADYRSVFNVTRETAKAELKRLVEEGYLVQEGERRGTRYLPGRLLGGEKNG